MFFHAKPESLPLLGALLLAAGLTSPALAGNRILLSSQYELLIDNSYAPPAEPPGLYVAEFSVLNTASRQSTSHQYRIYCPTKMVRSVTNGRWSKDAYHTQEDQAAFAGLPVLVNVVANVCPSDNRGGNNRRNKLPGE